MKMNKEQLETLNKKIDKHEKISREEVEFIIDFTKDNLSESADLFKSMLTIMTNNEEKAGIIADIFNEYVTIYEMWYTDDQWKGIELEGFNLKICIPPKIKDGIFKTADEIIKSKRTEAQKREDDLYEGLMK